MRQITVVLAAALAAFVACVQDVPPRSMEGGGPIVSASPLPDANLIPGRYMVKLKDGYVPQEVQKMSNLVATMRAEYGIAPRRTFVKSFAAELTPEQVARLQADPRVAAVKQQRWFDVALAPKGPKFSQVTPTGVRRVGVNPTFDRDDWSWENAVIDTGIDPNHPDLRGLIVGGFNCDDDASSWIDDHGHGTHVTSTITAHANTFGVVGVSPGVKVRAVKAMNADGRGSTEDIVCAIEYVTTQAPHNGGRVKVVNMSIGGSGSSDNDCGRTDGDAMHEAMCRGRAAGLIFVVAAGNESYDGKYGVPSSFSDAAIRVMCLADSNGEPGATGEDVYYPGRDIYDADDGPCYFSNFFADEQAFVNTIMAPGAMILGALPHDLFPDELYKAFSGTSMASPHVVGVINWYLLHYPNADFDETYAALIAASEHYGYGHYDDDRIFVQPVVRVAPEWQ